MNLKNNWQDFKNIVDTYGIKKLYHFTDRENLESIIRHGALLSWADCEKQGINIPKPGGSFQSRELDKRDGLQNFVRVSFVKQHPMMYVAMNDGRISNPVILEIDPQIIWWQYTKYSDRNATKTGAKVGSSFADFMAIHFKSIKANKHFDLPEDEQMFFQAEVLVENSIPIEFITNINNFGFTIPSQAKKLQTKIPYTAQITRNTPTAFIFMIDQSVSMGRKLFFQGENMTMSEAVARIVNHQINELVLRCIKGSETRNYYDIAVIGYGHNVQSGWQGNLEGRDFVTPEELKENPYKKITIKEEKRTRRGIMLKEVEKVQWIEARHDGNWTHVHKAFDKVKELLNMWMLKHQNMDCYPPTIINITDGEFNGDTLESIQQKANELKSMFTNDGNVILFNIHIDTVGDMILFPINQKEVDDSPYSKQLYNLSSLLPIRYNEPIAQVRNQTNKNERHVAMAVNADMSTLIQLMDIGTPTNISQNR